MVSSRGAMSKSVVALLPVLLLGGCSSGSDPQCRFGADCASGVCSAQGTCVSVSGDAGHDALDAGTDAPDTALDTTPPGDTPVGCSPNDDDLITALELPFAAGLKATFRTATNVVVSTAGTTGAGGRLQWDFSGALSGDHDLLVETIPPSGAWWASQFPSATYATSITSAADLLGVFQVTPSALVLQGEVSSSDGGARTLLTNSTPVPTLQFPLDPSSA